MLRTFASHIRNQWAGFLSLFLVLTGGVAYAANTIGSTDVIDESLLSQDVKNGEVKNTDLAPNSVSTGKILNGEVRTIDVLNNDLTGADIANSDSLGSLEIGGLGGADIDESTLFNDNALTTADLADGSVGKGELGTAAVGASEIGDGIVDRFDPTPTLIDGGTAENGSYNTDQSVAACNAGEELIGGYGTWTDIAGANEEVFIQRVGLGHDNENVIVVGGNDSGVDRHLAAVATCLQP